MKTPQSPAPVAGDEAARPASAQPVEAIGAGREVVWRDVKDAPQDGTNILLKHRVHGVIEGWFSKGEWTDDTPISPREYTGDMWILGDDLSQDEVEFGPNGEILAGSVEGWLPLDTLAAPTPMGGEVEALREALRLTRERVRDWPLDDHETCMCGSPVEDHSIGSGHSPVSQADHAISMIVEGINEALAASSPSPAQGGVTVAVQPVEGK